MECGAELKTKYNAAAVPVIELLSITNQCLWAFAVIIFSFPQLPYFYALKTKLLWHTIY